MTACAIEDRTGSASDDDRPEEAAAEASAAQSTAAESTADSAATAESVATGEPAGERPPAPARPARPAERPAAGRFTIAADGSYGARLAPSRAEGGGWVPERWTLDGPEPYAVPLPGPGSEEPDSEVLPLADGQVLIHRGAAGHHSLSLLYPTGTGTGERPLGAVECEALRLLPPAPDGRSACALGHGERSTTLWLVDAGGFGPELIAEIPGHCTGGTWLDRTGQLLALDRELDGRTKAVAVDLGRGGETTPLLQITEDSDDRLALVDPDSGLLLVRSDAPGEPRLGWGVLGSRLPVRFPECLRPEGAEATPFAAQPGQMLMPEACAVAVRVDERDGTRWVGMWRPSERRLRRVAAPQGWLPDAGLWTPDGELRLPYVPEAAEAGGARCGLLRVRPAQMPHRAGPAHRRPDPAPAAAPEGDPAEPFAPCDPPQPVEPAADTTGAPRPVPLQQAPLGGCREESARASDGPFRKISDEPHEPQGPREPRWLRDRPLG